MMLRIEDLEIPVRHSARRKTLELTVERDGSLLMTVPSGVMLDVMEHFARNKLPWIYKKLAEKALMTKAIQHKRFVQGEGFLYLGRHYRL
ncbi:TPA: YgjP-like metallopeptidase domain-containing protein, partial [Aeromonas veronii]